ncbi:MAG TPA: twin-arginine translocase subunit TatC [Bacteroidetes bacterium]|nr:twin-arginine translocase subunit TatC [Bacteroidota bacterium]|tara:strand:+ start:764 stop:1621 length:858 start_codon:yes stop_codon:yes gene_type:complete
MKEDPTDKKEQGSKASRQHPPEKEMTFFDHLHVLRSHLFRMVVALCLCSIAVFAGGAAIFDYVVLAPTKSNFLTFRGLCYVINFFQGGGAECFSFDSLTLIATGVSDQFLLHFKASFYIGFSITFPYFIYEIWRFVSPGLYQKERRTAALAIGWSGLLFYVGVAFGYFFLVPLAIYFFANYQISSQIENTFTIGNILGFMSTMTLLTGLLFQLPILGYILGRLGVVTAEFARRNRRYATVIIFILSAVITPSDPGTMFLVALPLMLLYEVTILVIATTGKARMST